MPWKLPDRSALKPIDDEIAPLHKQVEALQKKITALCNKRAKLLDEIDQAAIDALPKNYTRWSKEQWAWVLETNHGESQAHYTFKSSIIQSMGMSCFGFFPDTNQPSIAIHRHGFNIAKMLKSIETLLPHLKPVTIKDTHHGEETGIHFELHGIEERCTSVAYVHPKGDVSLYPGRYSEPKEFVSIEALLRWYVLEQFLRETAE